MPGLVTRASSINRALDEIGDKWCLLIFQELFWGINSFNDMLEATGVSRGVLSNRLKWLQSVGCLRRESGESGAARPCYHLTDKSIELYDAALMAVRWERRWYRTPELDRVALRHLDCGRNFTPGLHCAACDAEVVAAEVDFSPGPGAARDVREKKVRRRSSIDVAAIPSRRATYRNLVNIVGDRWTANVIALSFHGLTRFDQFHRELPVATNILAERLRLLVQEGIFDRAAYRDRPVRYEYRLTAKGETLFPWFVALLQWGDRWCDPAGRGSPMLMTHRPCGQPLVAEVRCSECGGRLHAHAVQFTLEGGTATGS